MAKLYKTPGVYIEAIPKLPPAVAATESAVPVFIGYTQKDESDGRSVLNIPLRITSLQEFTEIYGAAKAHHITVLLDSAGQLASEVIVDPLVFSLHPSLELYFANGGGPCYIISCGIWPAEVREDESYISQSTALAAASEEKKITLIVLPDAALCGEANFYLLFKQALQQADTLQNRMVIVDIFQENKEAAFVNIQSRFRELIGDEHLEFGAAYYPYLHTGLIPFVEEENETIVIGDDIYKLRLPEKSSAEQLARSLAHANPALYNAIISSIKKNTLILPPSSAIAGIFCMADASRGVWKAPANVALNKVLKPMVKISNLAQEEMNVHDSGKSVNAIRTFAGKGVLVWGARTLMGNDNEWRYINVRRFFSWVNESVKLSIQPFVFEPNYSNTWLKVRAMIDNYFTLLWRSGALQGTKAEHAFFVHVGLNKTMTAQDILEGRMIIELGMAVVRPAEFIIFRLFLKMQNDN